MSLALTDPQLDAWIEANGPAPSGYGAFKLFLDECDREHQKMLDDLRTQLAMPEALKLYFVPRSGLQDVPF